MVAVPNQTHSSPESIVPVCRALLYRTGPQSINAGPDFPDSGESKVLQRSHCHRCWRALAPHHQPQHPEGINQFTRNRLRIMLSVFIFCILQSAWYPFCWPHLHRYVKTAIVFISKLKYTSDFASFTVERRKKAFQRMGILTGIWSALDKMCKKCAKKNDELLVTIYKEHEEPPPLPLPRLWHRTLDYEIGQICIYLSHFSLWVTTYFSPAT